MSQFESMTHFDKAVNLCGKLKSIRDTAVQIHGANYQDKIKPYCELIRQASEKHADKPLAEVCLRLCQHASENASEPDQLLMFAASFEEMSAPK